MSAAAIAELTLLATTLLEKIIPILKDALKSGEISVETQTELKQRIAALKLKLESGELGPHWDIPERP